MKRARQLNLSDYLPYLINRFGVTLVLWFSEQALSGHKLTIAMWRVLAVLADNDRLRLTDLSNLTSIEPSTVSRIVTRLVSLGLVRRTRRATNNREVSVELTSKGLTVTADLIPMARDLERVAISGISKRDLAIVKNALKKMHENLLRPDARRKSANGAEYMRQGILE